MGDSVESLSEVKINHVHQVLPFMVEFHQVGQE